MAVKYIWSLSLFIPQSAIEDAMVLLPEGDVGQTVFKADPDDRSTDPLWIIESLYLAEPDIAAFLLETSIVAATRGHAPYRHDMQQLPAQGWLKANQDSFAPIEIGRVIIHGAKDRAAIARHRARIELEASCAFGTGEHPTTYGCLMALQQLHYLKPSVRALDLGAGSAILAFALARLFKTRVIATDMDADSVMVAKENSRKNGLAQFVRCEKATGFSHRVITQNRPYDVIVSNIFARPLAKLAPAMRRHLKSGGVVILAGFLHKDAPRVANAYALQGMRLLRRLRFGNWSILVLKKNCRP